MNVELSLSINSICFRGLIYCLERLLVICFKLMIGCNVNRQRRPKQEPLEDSRSVFRKSLFLKDIYCSIMMFDMWRSKLHLCFLTTLMGKFTITIVFEFNLTTSYEVADCNAVATILNYYILLLLYT